MIVSIEKSEHFALLRVKAHVLGSRLLGQLIDEARKVRDENAYSYILLDLHSVEDVDETCYHALQELQTEMLALNGLLIAVNPQPFLLHLFQEHDLLLVPTENEAIEYVFMDQLEKQFLAGDEE